MTTAKKGVQLLVELCVKAGVEHVVISPGSRNAPLTIAFDNHPAITTYAVSDERCAAFYALGMAQNLRKPVVICCTSGSASLNYAPAISEAYYQRIPLVVLTADRPIELVDQGDGQSIRQKDVYHNYIKESFELPQEPSTPEELNTTSEVIRTALTTCLTHHAGPVHINIPLEEPLYEQVENIQVDVEDFEFPLPTNTPDLSRFSEEWNKATKKLILCGLLPKNDTLNHVLEELANDPSVVVLTEVTANLYSPRFIENTDRVLSAIAADETSEFIPDILVSIGDIIVSKKIKAFFRNNKPTAHWNIDSTTEQPDMFFANPTHVSCQPDAFVRFLLDNNQRAESSFAQKWKQTYQNSKIKHTEYLANCVYSDLKVFEILLDFIPDFSTLHLANSTPIRYAQLFSQVKTINYLSNRGVSGIDGSTSTAVGSAIINPNNFTTLITGDISFIYDSNAFWSNHLPKNLRVIVINNNGGGIFRFIEGPATTTQQEQFFEGTHNVHIESIAKTFNLPYYSAKSIEEIETVIPRFYDSQKDDKPAILEVFTPREVNDVVLKEYFKFQ